MEQAMFGMGCFWGAEKKFWQTHGVSRTAVGYAGGSTVDPTYRQVCSGVTGHAEVVLVEYDPAAISYRQLLRIFWEGHNPTQGMRQGNDIGTQYRSCIYCFGEQQLTEARDTVASYQKALDAAGKGTITTEILPAPVFYLAEDYHQRYLEKKSV